MKTSELLRKVKDKLAQPGVWIQGCLATADDVISSVIDPKANCFCLAGAMIHVAHRNMNDDTFHRLYKTMVLAVQKRLPPGYNDIAEFNDESDTTLMQIQFVLDLAIEDREKEGD